MYEGACLFLRCGRGIPRRKDREKFSSGGRKCFLRMPRSEDNYPELCENAQPLCAAGILHSLEEAAFVKALISGGTLQTVMLQSAAGGVRSRKDCSLPEGKSCRRAMPGLAGRQAAIPEGEGFKP
jgi:hypothetical protein